MTFDTYYVDEPKDLDDTAFIEWLRVQPDLAEFHIDTRARVYRLAHNSNDFFITRNVSWSTLARHTPAYWADWIAASIQRRVVARLER